MIKKQVSRRASPKRNDLMNQELNCFHLTMYDRIMHPIPTNIRGKKGEQSTNTTNK